MGRSNKLGIYCLEGDWDGVEDESSIEPILELLKRCDANTRYLHRDIGTREEFDHYLTKWKLKRFRKYPILYLGFHGEPDALYVGDNVRDPMTLDELAERLDGACDGRVVHFGSCSTLNVHGATLNRFLRGTGALAILGYREDVSWMEAAAFEVLLFSALQEFPLTPKGMKEVENYLNRTARGLVKHLRFRMAVRV